MKILLVIAFIRVVMYIHMQQEVWKNAWLEPSQQKWTKR